MLVTQNKVLKLRATERVRGEEDRARTAEEGSQTRATSRVARGQEQRAGIAEGGSQTRATRRVEGQEVRETDLQREMFRRYKEVKRLRSSTTWSKILLSG